MPSLRDDWETFVRTDSRFGRLLYARDASALQFVEALDSEKLRLSIDKLSRSDDRRFVFVAYYLLQPRVRRFFLLQIKELLRSISHSSVLEDDTSRGRLRGTVVWSRTLLERLSGRVDAATFLVRHPERFVDRPENQLLRLYFWRVARTATWLCDHVGDGTLRDEISQIQVAAEDASRSVYLRAVTQVPRATARMIGLARRHRNLGYGEVAFLYSQMMDGVYLGKWSVVQEYLRSGWLGPINDDDLFELYGLLLLVEVMIDELGFEPPEALQLIRSGRGAVAVMTRGVDGATARVYFDQSPSKYHAHPVGEWRYERVLAGYEGLKGKERRPDIGLMVTWPGGAVRRLLVEVKRSADDRYQRDSVYKVFGYLHDFADLWADCADQYPKAVLLYPTGVTPMEGGVRQEDLALASGDDRARIAELLRTALTIE